MTLALIAIIVTIVLCVCSNGKAQAAKWGTRSDSKLQFELYDKYEKEIFEMLDEPTTKGRTTLVSFMEIYKKIGIPSPYLDDRGDYIDNARDEYDEDLADSKGLDASIDMFFINLYNVVKTYSWTRHFPDKPIEDSNNVELSENETKAAHEFFLNNLQDYMYKRYWLEEFERDGLEYHCVLADPYEKYNFYSIKNDITKLESYIKSGVYDEEFRVEIYRRELFLGHDYVSSYEREKYRNFFYNFIPVFPSIPMFCDCPILPPSPPEELLSKTKTALHRAEDLIAIYRCHNCVFWSLFGKVHYIAKKKTTKELRAKGICVASWNGEDTLIQETEKRMKRDEELKKKNPQYPYLDPIPPETLRAKNPRVDKLSKSKYYKHYEDEFERVSDEYRERMRKNYFDKYYELLTEGIMA